MAYPLEVLSTNRILRSSTSLEKAGSVEFFSQVSKTTQKGVANLWRGFVPFVATTATKSYPVVLAMNANGQFNALQGAVFTAIGTLLANPFEIITTRFQNFDYTRTKLTKDVKKIWVAERTRLF